MLSMKIKRKKERLLREFDRLAEIHNLSREQVEEMNTAMFELNK